MSAEASLSLLWRNSSGQIADNFRPLQADSSLCLTKRPRNQKRRNPLRKWLPERVLTVLNCALNWVQGLDLNQRPSGYEPDERLLVFTLLT